MPKILILDEKPGVREVLGNGLAERGYLIWSLGNADLFLEAARCLSPDLVIVDFFFRGRTRWEFLARIKGSNPVLPVLVISSFPGDREDPRIHSADGILIKDFYFDDLLRKIDGLLNGSQKKRIIPPRDRRLPTCSAQQIQREG